MTILFNFKKDNLNISSIKKFPYKESDSNLLRLMKYINEENKYWTKYYTYKDRINFKDSISHYSNTSMHMYANQQFLNIEKFLILTSSELITLGKIRPLDLLLQILKLKISDNDDNAPLNKFIIEHSVYEVMTLKLI